MDLISPDIVAEIKFFLTILTSYSRATIYCQSNKNASFCISIRCDVQIILISRLMFPTQFFTLQRTNVIIMKPTNLSETCYWKNISFKIVRYLYCHLFHRRKAVQSKDPLNSYHISSPKGISKIPITCQQVSHPYRQQSKLVDHSSETEYRAQSITASL